MLADHCFLAISTFLISLHLVNCDQSLCLEDDYYCQLSDQCIPQKLRCNGHTDCYWSEDEKGCSCAMWCDNRQRCVLRREKCDGVVQCRDGSDEVNCTTINCAHDKFACQVNQTTLCLDNSLRCDEQQDCDDRYDEQACETSPPPRPPPPTCDEASGPNFCPNNVVLYRKLAACPLSSRFGSTFRLDINLLHKVRYCDTIPDCPLGEDEINCGGKVNCTGLFACADGLQCLREEKVCDGLAQCSDGSDEFALNCLKQYRDQEPDAYKSDDKCPHRCRIPANFSNATAEERSALLLPYARFCISLEQVCDNVDDCPLGDDEDRVAHGCQASNEIRTAMLKCGSNSAVQCDEDSTDCVVTEAFGPVCVCKPGFQPVSQSVTRCVDIDECARGACEHSCENLLGSFACGCQEGYHMTLGNCQRCEALTFEEEPYFLFSTPHLIYRMDRASQMTRVNLYHASPEKSRPTWSGSIPFDYHRADDLLIFYDWGEIKGKLSRSGAEPWHFARVDHDITWLAYDDLHNNVYYNNGNDGKFGYFWKVFHVGIFREKGAVTQAARSIEVKTIIINSSPDTWATNFVPYPEMGLAFFSVHSTKSSDKLLHCALNGEDLITAPWKFTRIVSLSIDRTAGYVYVLDVGRPGLAHIQVNTESSPATVGELSWIEERRAFFGPRPFVAFAAGEFGTELYFLTSEISATSEVRTSFQTFNKSSLSLFNQHSYLNSPFTFIPSGLLLLNTSLVRVRSVAYSSVPLDACFHERQHHCETFHICLTRPPPPGLTSGFTRAVCECPDQPTAPCTPRAVPIRADFTPPGRPVASMNEFRQRSECNNLVLQDSQSSQLIKKHRQLVSQSKLNSDEKIGARDEDLLSLNDWPANLTGSFENDLQAATNAEFEALVSSYQSSSAKLLSSFTQSHWIFSVIYGYLSLMV